MEKIVIINDDQEMTSFLIECLGLLFPECDIQVREKAFDENPTAGEYELNHM